MLEHFEKLSLLLLKYEALWKHNAFKDIHFSKLNNFPELKTWLFELPESTLLSLQDNDHLLLSSAEPYFNDARIISQLISFNYAQNKQNKPIPKFWDTDIPGRKAQQILAFSQSLGLIDHPILDWCCGKQHLGRFLSVLNNQVSIGLEIDADLVKQANQLAEKKKLSPQVHTVQCDALSNQALIYIENNQHAVALHACGGLHTNLLKVCSNQDVKRISFSPCCYHRFNESDNYMPLSFAAKQSGLELNTDDLRLAVRETKTASSTETRNRKQLQTWRLGFDLLQRELRQENSYLETPSLSTQILQHDFEYFCLHLMEIKDLGMTQEVDFEFYEKEGVRRFHQYERAELFRMIFRRALETWLVLDKALFLEEQGYTTKVDLFCSPDISPRNFFIDAQLNI